MPLSLSLTHTRSSVLFPLLFVLFRKRMCIHFGCKLYLFNEQGASSKYGKLFLKKNLINSIFLTTFPSYFATSLRIDANDQGNLYPEIPRN